MNGIKLYSAAVVVAIAPAVVGLVGNSSFSESVPVRIPEQVSSTPETPEPAPSPRTISAKPTPKAEDRQDDRGRRHGGHGADDGPGPDHSTTDRSGPGDGDDGDDHGRHRRGHDGPDNSGTSENDVRKAREDRIEDQREAREDRLDALRDAREERDSSGKGSGGDDRRDSDDDRDGDSSGHGSGD